MVIKTQSYWMYLSFYIMLLLFSTNSAHGQRKQFFYNATIIDGKSDVKPFIGSILIEDGLIKRVYKGSTFKPSKGVKLIDCTGKFITPGLFDAHIHLATADLSDWSQAKVKTDSILLNMVRHGVTSLRDMAGDARYLKSYQDEIQAGLKIGPALFYAAQFAGESYFEMYSRGSRKKGGIYPWERSIGDTTDIGKAVKEAKETGVTAIKTYADLSKEQFREIVRQANKNGLLVWSHATIFPLQPMDAINENVKSLSHAADIIFQQLPIDSVDVGYAWEQVYKGMKVDEVQLSNLFKEMAKRKIFMDGTVYHATQNDLYYAIDIMKLAHQEGVPIVAGTDWIYPEENGMIPLYDEARIYTEKVGLTTLETIETLTYHAALVTGLKDRGRVAKGYRADFLLVEENPIRDIIHIFKPKSVFIAGNRVAFEN